MPRIRGRMTTEKTISDQKRLYQVWNGKNTFMCDGRLIFGPDAVSVVLTALMILAPSLAFCFQTILKIKTQANLVQEDTCILGLPVLIVASIITLSDLIFLCYVRQ